MDQIIIDFTAPRPMARSTDRQNSHAAAGQAVMLAARHRSLIWNALREHGPLGRFNIARHTGLDPIAVARRLPELVRHGLARVKDDEIEITPSGRTGSVWEATA